MSEEKFSKCEEGEKKNVSVEFRVFGKKWKLKEKFGKKKEVFSALHKENEVKKKNAKFAFTGWVLG